MSSTLLTLDLETEAIGGEGPGKQNPSRWPPRPVGMAYKWLGTAPRYLRWGHPSGNNCGGPDKAKRIVAQAIQDGVPLLFHNSKFDTAVMMEHWGMAFPDPLKVHDTMFQIFLYDPYASSFSLKPSAERILGMAPEEQEELRDWILAHIPCKPTEWGAHIADAPGALVSPYARGDVRRTEKLFRFLRKRVPLEAYQREQKLMPIIQRAEKLGIALDTEHFQEDIVMYEETLVRTEDWLRRTLKADHIDFNKGDQVADALERAGKVGRWVLTPTGRRSTSKENLEAAIKSPLVLKYLRYRNALAHCMSMFFRPWAKLEHGGRLFPEWNQVRQAKTDRDPKGTRTGRLSSNNPNFQNPPNEYTIEVPKGYPTLPIMRKYLVPDKGYVWCKRDYSQQELRILAHFSEGRLFDRYQENPKIDAHAETGELIKEHAHKELPRKYIKITGFSVIYGSGLRGLAQQLDVQMGEAETVRSAYFKALPEVPSLMRTCMNCGRSGEGITTWGGRHYIAEVAPDGRRFDYKLLNYLIQGSAADCTKEALIRWDSVNKHANFLVTVHDENNIQAPRERWKKDMRLLREAMESIEFDVKMLSDGFVGDSWAKLEATE